MEEYRGNEYPAALGDSDILVFVLFDTVSVVSAKGSASL